MTIDNQLIGIIDSGMGNILSVHNALLYLGADVRICTDPDDLDDVERVILPGVGSFFECMNHLHKTGLYDVLKHKVGEERIPIMGICLGMQIMAKKGTEGGEVAGFGWIDGTVVRIDCEYPGATIPHMGWNDIDFVKVPLFRGLPSKPDLYFVHSYHMRPKDSQDIIATATYGSHLITAAIQRNNVFGTQFHPEKSQEYGLRILKNFLEWKT